MPIIAYEDVLQSLQIEAVGENVYRAPNVAMPYRRIFGGQLLSQAIVIATATCEQKQVKSIHAGFPREGDLARPVAYRVERIQDGRSFASRWLVGEQDGRCVLTASVSLHAHESGPSHQHCSAPPGGVEDADPVDLGMIPWETRVVGGADLESRGVAPAEYAFYMRTPKLAADQPVHRALFAHATDLTLIGTALRPVPGFSEADSPERIQTAVTTHTIWFHRPLRVDDWLLLSQESPTLAHGRGFGRGQAFDSAGSLVASYAQESLIRRVGDA